MDGILTAPEVAARQRISVATVQRALRNGRLKGYRVGGRGDWRTTEADYAAWMAEGAPTWTRLDEKGSEDEG